MRDHFPQGYRVETLLTAYKEAARQAKIKATGRNVSGFTKPKIVRVSEILSDTNHTLKSYYDWTNQ